MFEQGVSNPAEGVYYCDALTLALTGVQYWATHTLSWVNGLPYIRCVVTGLVSEVSEVITEVVCVLAKGNTTRWRCANSVSLTLRVT